MLCVTVFLSYLPEAGQYSCIFVYLKLVSFSKFSHLQLNNPRFPQVMGFSVVMVAIFIAVIGILSVCAQLILGFLMRVLGSKKTIMVGLFLEMLQLLWYGLGSQTWSVNLVRLAEWYLIDGLQDDVGSWTPGLHFQHHVSGNQRFRLHAHRRRQARYNLLNHL
jgi:hypothetical protein